MNSTFIKLYLVVQVLANDIAIILFSSLYCIIKKHSQKRYFSIKDKDIIKLFFCLSKKLHFSLINILTIIYIWRICNCTNICFFEQLSIVYPLLLQLKYFLSFISRNIFIFKFQGIEVIVPQSILDRHEKEILFSDIVGTWEELMTALKGV